VFPGLEIVVTLQGLARSVVLAAGPDAYTDLVTGHANDQEQCNRQENPNSLVTNGEHERELEGEEFLLS
jgi:hypothetical protein